MNYRIAPDPHRPEYEWRVACGQREIRMNTLRTAVHKVGDDPYNHLYISNWYQVVVPGPLHPDLFEHTLERVALWADLTLQPCE